MSKPPPFLTAIPALALALAATAPTLRAADEAAVLADATRTLEQMAANPNTGVPIALLRQSEGVVLVPNMLNASFLVGAKFGRGVFLVRDSRGEWGNPVVVFVTGGSLGLQAGAQATEVLMVFRAKTTVNRLLAGKGKVTLGVDAGVAAGPSGTQVGANTDIEMRAEILTYARSRGLFAGAALGGAGIRVDRNSNGLYYDNFAATTFGIIEGRDVVVPIEAAKLKAVLAALTDPPQADDREEDDGAPVDRSVSRSARAPRRAAAMDGDDAMPAPGGRRSTRRRAVDPSADEPDDPPAPRQARAVPRRRPPSGVDEPDDGDLPRPAARPRDRQPVADDDPAAEDTPPPRPKRKAAPRRSTPRDSAELPG